MGGGTYDHNAYRAFASTTANKTTEQIYKSRSMHASLDPKGVKVRESRDSDEHPDSTPVIVAIDVTGSMDMIADVIVRSGLGTLFNGILDRKPVPDPQVMFMAVGDANTDRAPLQVSQFESDNRIVEQLTNIWIEHGGGGNSFESYNLPWFFAANHTVHDRFEKRGKRGFLFTVGDECAPADLQEDQIEEIMGYRPEQVLTTSEILEQAQRFYDVYHIIIEQGDYARHNLDKVRTSWRRLLGERAISLSDYEKLAETIVSLIEVAQGVDAVESAARWGGDKAGAVLRAVRNVPQGIGGIDRPRLPGKGA